MSYTTTTIYPVVDKVAGSTEVKYSIVCNDCTTSMSCWVVDEVVGSTEAKTVLRFSGTNNFINNLAESGGPIFSYDNTVLSFNGINNFIKNSATNYGGGAISTYDSVIAPPPSAELLVKLLVPLKLSAVLPYKKIAPP